MSDTKPSNPKDAIGSSKAQLSLVPWTLVICAARALLEGALKYGRFNWRVAGVRASIYLDALKRHVAKWENGQNNDPKTRVHHLDNAIACLTIMRDAELYGMLTDDRPPCPDPDRMAEMIDGEVHLVAHLKHQFRDHNPKQYTIEDTCHVPMEPELAAEVDRSVREPTNMVSALSRIFREVDEAGPKQHHGLDAVPAGTSEAERVAAEREALRVNAAIDEVAELCLHEFDIGQGRGCVLCGYDPSCRHG